MKISSTIAVLNDGKILLGKRRDTGKFTLPGGGMEKNETPEECAKRELWEESGIKAERLTHIVSWKIWDGNRNLVRIIHGYKLIYDGPTTVKLDPDQEVKKWQWISFRYGNLPFEVETNLAYKNNKLLQELGVQKTYYIKSEPRLYVNVIKERY